MRVISLVLAMSCGSQPSRPAAPTERGQLVPPGTTRVLVKANTEQTSVDFIDHGTTIDTKLVTTPGCVDITPGTDHIDVHAKQWSIVLQVQDGDCEHYEMLHRMTRTAGERGE